MSRPKTLYRAEQGWQRWSGGECPVHPETIVRVWLKGPGEAKHQHQAQHLDWGKLEVEGERRPGAILGYLVVQEAA